MALLPMHPAYVREWEYRKQFRLVYLTVKFQKIRDPGDFDSRFESPGLNN